MTGATNIMGDSVDPQCEARIWHGPGHQSATRCTVKGKHEIHECEYGQFDQLARWIGGDVFSTCFDEPPQDPEEN